MYNREAGTENIKLAIYYLIIHKTTTTRKLLGSHILYFQLPCGTNLGVL